MRAITIEVYWSFSQSRIRNEDQEQPTSDLISRCKQEYGLPEQEQQSGEMIRYGLFRGEGQDKQELTAAKSLRELRVQDGDRLYLSPQHTHWWRKHPGATNNPPDLQPVAHSTLPLAPRRLQKCQVELAPGCICPVPENGLRITRDFLLKQLPRPLVLREQARTWVNMPSRLAYVSNNAQGHCAIVWKSGWYLFAHKPVCSGDRTYTYGVAVPLDQSTNLLLGRSGWPITIRLDP